MQYQFEDNRYTTNVGFLARLASTIAGSWMVMRRLRRPSFGNLMLVGSGAVLIYRGFTGRSRLYRELHISGLARQRNESASIPDQTGVKIESAVTVARPPQELYRFWRNPERLPEFMNQIQSVTRTGPDSSHWVAKGPFGGTLEWDAEVINDQPDALISWKSSPDSQIANAGSVSFMPLGDGRRTEVKLVLEYKPRGGPPGAAMIALLGKNPRHQIARDLERFKRLMETGVTGQLYGPRT
jgi:uncharacterized membrane protein